LVFPKFAQSVRIISPVFVPRLPWKSAFQENLPELLFLFFVILSWNKVAAEERKRIPPKAQASSVNPILSKIWYDKPSFLRETLARFTTVDRPLQQGRADPT
jgi:hypothetical protein